LTYASYRYPSPYYHASDSPLQPLLLAYVIGFVLSSTSPPRSSYAIGYEYVDQSYNLSQSYILLQLYVSPIEIIIVTPGPIDSNNISTYSRLLFILPRPFLFVFESDRDRERLLYLRVPCIYLCNLVIFLLSLTSRGVKSA
jgi:hypothetical protein